jgi:outer membrane protein TolC
LGAYEYPRPTNPNRAAKQQSSGIQLASTQEPAGPAKPTPDATPNRLRPAYAQTETLPIDLPTVIRLVDANSPSVGFAQARVREAQARLKQAEIQWLPNLSVGAAYTRFDGQTQNQRGDVFGVSRSNLFASGGPALNFDFAEAIYRPLIERRLNAAEQQRLNAVVANAEFEAVSTYLELVQLYASLDINAETLKQAEAMLKAAENAKNAKLDRTAGDIQRAQTEVLFRQTERITLEGRVGATSARLGRLLLLQPSVKLVPADAIIAPITLIDPATTIDQLLAQAVANRPDLAANREAIAAAWEQVNQQKRGPFLPKMTIANQTGVFGGGLNNDLQNFSSRNALNVQLFWELRNLGLGNRAEVNQRQAQLDQAQYQMIDSQARAVAEIVEAAHVAGARYEALELAERAVKEATELYRINKEGTFNVVDAKNLFDALRPLQAIQALNQARQSYLTAVIEFNRAQYQLLTLIGSKPSNAAK